MSLYPESGHRWPYSINALPGTYALANKGIDTRTLQAYLGHRGAV
jgi:hypothetical protein